MRAAAAADGIDLVAFSGFRDFDRQLGHLERQIPRRAAHAGPGRQCR